TPTPVPAPSPVSNTNPTTGGNNIQNPENNTAVTDYQLLKPSQSIHSDTTKYLDDGVIDSGDYSGYHRIIEADVEDFEMGGPGTIYRVFITKDYKSFYYYDTYKTGDLSQFNSNVVGSVSDIPFNQPATISVGNFVLVRGTIDFVLGWNMPVSEINFGPQAENVKTVELPMNMPGLKFSAEEGDYSYNYIAGSNGIDVEDNSGLVIGYRMTSKENYIRQQQNCSTNVYCDVDSDFYVNTDFSNSSSFYNGYNTSPVPSSKCGMSDGTILKNVSDSDFIPITTTSLGTQIYIPKDQNSQLNQDQFSSKIGDDYNQYVSTDPKPTFQQYMVKNPVIIVKDPWGRFLMLGEEHYNVVGGCGKPVVYLYPKIPTEVKVSLEKPTRFDVDIPTYKNGWDVLANPDGLLKDLQPQYTDCSKIDTQVFGSEYAADACKNNTYPYLYWSGQVDNIYPEANTGWVVARSDLESFINQKLAIIGLNEKERADMIGYWVPELVAKNAPYYRISFFQTAEMNKFAPMNIIPKPDTLIRVFLDWSPLTDNNINMQPEILNHIDRQGFTAVEWGGLKQ
ncbi:MAG: hypothetical protein ABSA74_02535, partial [Candidatus Staskawiczbacteria bacterium]